MFSKTSPILVAKDANHFNYNKNGEYKPLSMKWTEIISCYFYTEKILTISAASC